MKRMLALILCICMLLGMIPGQLPGTVKAAEENPYAQYQKNLEFQADGKTAYCPACQQNKEWTAINGNTVLSAVSHYYLAEDVVCTKGIFLSGSYKTCFNLNGHNVTATGTDGAIFSIGATFNLMGQGTVSGNYVNRVTGATIYVGTVGANYNIYSGTIKKSSENNNGAIVCIGAPGGTINMYGGTIDATGISNTNRDNIENSPASAVMIIGKTGTPAKFNMFGGKIIGGTNAGRGGAVRVGACDMLADRVGGAFFTMYGGEIIGGVAQQGGSIYANNNCGGLKISGGSIDGDVYVTGGVNLELSGTANIAEMDIATDGKLTVDGNWTGAATASFTAELTDGQVPDANGASTGAFTGTLNTASGSKIIGAEGKLVVKQSADELVLDANSQGYCAVCDENVTWTAIRTNGRIGALSNTEKAHYYLAENVKSLNAQFAELESTSLCLHLNGKDLTQRGRVQVSQNSIFNVLGNGHVTFTGDVTSTNATNQAKWRIAAINMEYTNSQVNLYGGTYDLGGQALTVNVPVIRTANNGACVSLYENTTINGEISIGYGSLLLSGNANTKKIAVGVNGKLTVDAVWTGVGKVSFASGLTDNLVPEANGASTGVFSGTLQLTDGRFLEDASGRLLAKDPNAELKLDADGKALCPVCDEMVTWLDVNNQPAKRVGPHSDGAHHHFYLSQDVVGPENAQFAELEYGTSACLHLNGKNLTYSGRMRIGISSTFNIMGSGTVCYEGDCVNSDPTTQMKYNSVAIELSQSTSALNLYGGTYLTSGVAAEDNKPIISVSSAGQLLLKNAVIKGNVIATGLTASEGGTVTLSGTATADYISLTSGIQLIVEEGWEGQATTAFSVSLVENAIPQANGVATGDFAGGLRTQEGIVLKGENGLLVADDNKLLRLTEADRGYCQVCSAMVTWTPIKANGRVGVHEGPKGAHLHYYFAEDDMTTLKAQFMEVTGGVNVCLHLNGKTVSVPGRMNNINCVMNIMGDGKVDFTAATGNEQYDCGLFYVKTEKESVRFNLYGGTYTSSAGKPIIKTTIEKNSQTQFNLLGDVTIDGFADVDYAKLTLTKNAVVKEMLISGSGRVSVDRDWVGHANVRFVNRLINDSEIPYFNGLSNGDFVGGLVLPDGRQLMGRNGKLLVAPKHSLRLNEQNQGYCHACDAVVTWTAVEGENRIGYFENATHQHYYLSGDLQCPDRLTQVLGVQNTNFCLHLNGHNMTHGGRIYAGGTSVLNILGDGNVTFTATTTSPGTGDIYIRGGIYTDGGKVNLYGGTYQVAGKAAELGKPTIYAKANVMAKDAIIKGTVKVEKQTFIVDGTTTFENALIHDDGRLSVLKSWKGNGVAAFEAPITGNLIPLSNGVINGDFVGKLTLSDGRALTRKGNNLLIGGETISENLTYRIRDNGAELVAYTGEGNFLLPAKIAGKPVTAIADGAFDDFTGKLYIGMNNAVGLAYAREKGIAYEEVATFTQDNGVIQLQADAESLTFEQDTYLDLNGYNVENVTVTADTLYVMDSQTDDYTVADGVYGNIVNITGLVQAADGYLKVTQAEGVSFHCVALNIDAMTLRPEVAGVYYNSTIAGDEIVAKQVETYGVALSVNEDMRNSGYSVFHNFTAGATTNAKGTLLKNVMKTGLSDEKNSQRAQMPVYGRAYIKTADGYIFGETVCRDTKTQIELANEGWEDLNKAQKDSARAMYETYETAMEDWAVDNMSNYIDRLWYTQAAQDSGTSWERSSLPIGNGYMGVSIFGGTESETLVISDKTMYNPVISEFDTPAKGPDGEEFMRAQANGMANMCKAYIDFDHPSDQVTNYQRDLVLENAEAHVSYDYEGVTYNRTYFASYPDNVTVTRLTASQPGKLAFTLRPVATYVRDYCVNPGDGAGKTGTVTASGDTAIVSGMLNYYQINYEAQFKVIPVGGTMIANADGTITVTGADSADILLSVGTNYEMTPEVISAAPKEKLDPNKFPHDAVTTTINAAAQKGYAQLQNDHRADFQELYSRVELDLGGTANTAIPTDEVIEKYRNGENDAYLEQLLFKYGRYLLISSARENTLPPNLQGIWNYYCGSAWGGQYVYNINQQVLYWPTFTTNLIELYEPHIEYFDMMWETLQENADNYLTAIKSPYLSPVGTGANGIGIGTVATPYSSPSIPASVSYHSGPGTTGYTSSLFWEYYDFTRDKQALEDVVYPYLEGAATFLSKTLENYDGKWLVTNSKSPENNLYFEDTNMQTVGTMFDQMMVYETFVQELEAARILGYTAAEHSILDIIEERIDKLDHVVVGKSGQVKEYREEEYYGEFGLREHHGVSQLVGLQPGTSINSKTDAWQDAAAVSLTERGLTFTGHEVAKRTLNWARLKEGENAYVLIEHQFHYFVYDNMWSAHPPFQMDGNAGYTASVAEMLLQSHEDYIEVLPAIPEAWATGSYKGLTARGNFEVDVAWENGNATEIVITSKAGEDCSLNHFRISTATVVDSKGNPVAFTVDSDDQITFATVEGESYTITGLSEKVVVETPADLTLTGNFDLSWEASPDAVSYKVYRAVNSQATYELVAENVTGTTYSYKPTDLAEGDQVIMRVTAVNADGLESEGIRAITWVKPKKALSEVTYVAFGDSITYGIDGNYNHTEAGYKMEKPYPTLVGETLGLAAVNNQGVSGATFCVYPNRTSMTEKILTFTGNADIISLMLGVNDFSAGYPLGDITSRDNTTIYGCLHLISKQLKTKYPDAFIFYMTPFQSTDTGKGAYTLEDVAKAIKTVAAEYGIPVLDMYVNGKYENEMNLSNNDGVHPSQQHHIDYTAPLICEFIREHY